jgi:hypothetical protein
MLSSHLYLGLPCDLLVRGFQLNIFLTVLVSGILCTWPNQLRLWGELALPCVNSGLAARRSIAQRRLENVYGQDSEIQKTAFDGSGRVTGTDNWQVATAVQRSRLNRAFSRQDWWSHLEAVNNPGNFLERSCNINHYDAAFNRSSS